jgi:hypothetical protein
VFWPNDPPPLQRYGIKPTWRSLLSISASGKADKPHEETIPHNNIELEWAIPAYANLAKIKKGGIAESRLKIQVGPPWWNIRHVYLSITAADPLW